ncbi:MAG: cytochrome P450, partial [Chloroflexi bacterium]|nr:cytochrome P450 [Chloroflexota bacterium]
AEMRHQTSPVRINHTTAGQSAYFITRYHDAMTVLKDPRFINDARKLPGWNDWTKKWYVPTPLKTFVDSMALADEPDHTRLRSLVHKAFTPSRVQQLAGDIERIANELLDAAASKREIDFMADYALPLPLTVIADMMGVPQPDRTKFRRWMSNTIADISPNDRLKLIPKMLNALGLNGLLKRLVEDRRRNPRDDLTTALVQAEEAGDRLSEDELIAMLFLILFAGHETTVNLIGSGTLALLQHPDQFAQLKANPDLMDSAIEELLRYTNPVQHIAYRYALEAVTLGDIEIPQYGTALVGIGAANRDETVFENPEVLNITRHPNPHVAFGFGIHYCLGAPLARLEAKIAFSTLFERFPNLQLAAPADQLQWRGAPSLRGLVSLPVRLQG